jgi:hypothetical protein
MSLAGVRSNRGDGYQTTVALGLVIDMLTDPHIAWIEVDSTSLAADGAPIGVDDVVVRYSFGRTDHGQCKKNQKNFDSWSIDDLKNDLTKSGKTLATDSQARIAFYSRSPFGEIHKLREHASTQPDAIAYRKSLTKELAEVDSRLRACWVGTLPQSGEVYEHLLRLDFSVTAEIEAMLAQQLSRLRQNVTQAEAALDALWARVDQLGARIVGVTSPSEDSHRLTRQDLLNLLAGMGSSVAPARSLQDLEVSFRDLSAIGRSWKRDVGTRRIPRLAVEQLLTAIRSKAPDVLLTDGPGAGKTCVLLDLLDALENEPGVSTVFIQGREFANCRTDAERSEYGLMPDLVAQISRMAELRHTVVVLDSLDVLSLARDHAVLQFFLRVIDQLALRKNVTVVAACRSFDLKYVSQLASRKWANTVTIGSLQWKEEIEPLVLEWRVDTGQLDPATRDLLGNPRNLALFAEVVTRTGVFNVSTAQALTRRYLEVVVGNDDLLGDAVMLALELMAHEMLFQRRLEVASARAGLTEDVLRRLSSAGVLHRSESGNLAFGHQTLLDALAVRKAEREGRTLLTFVQSLPPVPFVRPAVRSFFAYLASGDRRPFRAQVRAVLDSDAVAYHLKRLVAESLAEIVPQRDDWGLIQHILRQHVTLFDSLYYASQSDAWHDFWSAQLVPLILKERDGRLLSAHARRAGDWMESRPAEIIAFWSTALQSVWGDEAEIRRTISHHLGKFKAWNANGVRQLVETMLNRPPLQHDLTGVWLSRFVEATDSGDDLLWQYIAGHLTEEHVFQYQFGEQLQCEPHEFGSQEDLFLARRMECSESLLCVAVRAVEGWSAVRGRRFSSQRELRSEFLRETSYGRAHSTSDPMPLGALDVLLTSIESAITKHASRDSHWWQTNAPSLAASTESALRYIVIRACIGSPKPNRQLIGRILLDPTNLDSRLDFELGELIHAAFLLLDEQSQDAITQAVLDVHSAELNGTETPEWVLRKRAGFLRAIPMFARSSDAQATLDRVERQFGSTERRPSIETGGGRVLPPFSYEEFFQISDAGIIRILEHYRTANRRDEFWEVGDLVGGAEEVGWQLREAASRDPERFMRILVAHWNEVPERFRSPQLAGASSYLEKRFGNLRSGETWRPLVEPDPRSLATLVLDELERHPEHWAESREGADAIEACANVVETARDAGRLVALGSRGIEVNDSSLENFQTNDLVTTGINSIRGNAAEGMIILATRWAKAGRSLPEGLRSCLLRYAADLHPAVPAVLLRRLPWLQAHDPTLGWEVFAKAVERATDALWAVAEPCLYWAYQRDFPVVKNYLQRIDASGGAARETWGRISMLACLSGHVAWEDLLKRLLELNDGPAWKGVVAVLANNAGAVAHREACFDGMLAAFEHAPDRAMVVAEMSTMFRVDITVIPIRAILVRRRFEVAAQSQPPARLHLHDFDVWLAALADSAPDLALEVGRIFANFIASHSVPIYSREPIGQFLTRLFREGEDREEADSGAMLRQVIELQDALLARGVYGLQEWLRAAERP